MAEVGFGGRPRDLERRRERAHLVQPAAGISRAVLVFAERALHLDDAFVGLDDAALQFIEGGEVIVDRRAQGLDR